MVKLSSVLWHYYFSESSPSIKFCKTVFSFSLNEHCIFIPILHQLSVDWVLSTMRVLCYLSASSVGSSRKWFCWHFLSCRPVSLMFYSSSFLWGTYLQLWGKLLMLICISWAPLPCSAIISVTSPYSYTQSFCSFSSFCSQTTQFACCFVKHHGGKEGDCYLTLPTHCRSLHIGFFKKR